eukprot:30850-Pelagococcus_subviridis.AAC.27
MRLLLALPAERRPAVARHVYWPFPTHDVDLHGPLAPRTDAPLHSRIIVHPRSPLKRRELLRGGVAQKPSSERLGDARAAPLVRAPRV